MFKYTLCNLISGFYFLLILFPNNQLSGVHTKLFFNFFQLEFLCLSSSREVDQISLKHFFIMFFFFFFDNVYLLSFFKSLLKIFKSV